MFSYYLARGRQLCCLLALISLTLNLRHLGAEFSLPQNLRVDSEVEIYTGGKVENYVVEELIDNQDGNVHLRVSDLTNSAGTKDLTSYYRIREPNDKIKTVNNWILSYSYTDMMCRSSRISDWQLKELSTIISILFEINTRSEMLAIKDDRTAIGPSTLLRIVQANAHLFTFMVKAFDGKHLTDVYYFKKTFYLRDSSQAALMIFSIPAQSIKDPLQAETTFSSLNSTVYPKSLTVMTIDITNNNIDNMDPFSLIDGKIDGSLKRLVSHINLIQERCPSRHMGLKLGSLDERNPFSLPPGAGCSGASRASAFYIEANQFSGLFVAKDSKVNRFLAYDKDSNHLRIDSVGHYKMIYDLKRRRQVYIDDTSEPSNDEDQIKCAQSYWQDSQEDDMFHDIRFSEDIIGIAKHTGLLYLGTKLLEDGSHCVVYEREISASQIPLINRLTMRYNARTIDRLFLVYYFIDELVVENRDPLKLPHEALWLKRIELKSVSPISKYKILNSQVTFSEFTWSLESAAEDTHSRELKMGHPVGAFDTVECVAARDQMKLEFLITQELEETQVMESEQQDTVTQGQGQFDIDSLLVDRLEFMEESVMSFLTLQKGLSRSQIGELELGLPTLGDNSRALLVRAKLIDPLKFNWERKLVGWIYNVDVVPFGKHGTFISSESMARYECSMKLAVKMGNKKQIDMLYCPNVGCGYITDLKGLNVTKKIALSKDDWPTIGDNYYLCEVHDQIKDTHIVRVVDSKDKLSGKLIESLWNSTHMTIDTNFPASRIVDQQGESHVFRGIISKISARVESNSNSLGVVLRRGSCFTKGTQSNDSQELDIRILELAFELQHSSVHCHKACQLHAGCQTYSYHGRERICTLTNVPKLYINEDKKLNGLREDANCVLYSIDSIHLFESTNVLMTSLDRESEHKKMECYVTKANLTECANLCHLNEFNCHGFVYYPLNKYCFLEDKGSYLYKKLHGNTSGDNLNPAAKKAYFINLVGANDWNSHLKSYSYNRNYKHHYLIENRVMVDVEKISILIPINDDEIQQSIGSTDYGYNLVPGPLFYGLNEKDCLRECAIVNQACIMVDHYLRLNSTGLPKLVCATYELRIINLMNPIKMSSNESIGNFIHHNNSLSSNLNGLESAKSGLLKSNLGCTHYHLAGDNLWLRAKLVNFSFSRVEDDERKLLEQEDLESSSNYIINLRDFIDHHIATSTPAKSDIIPAIFLLSIGLVLGFFLTLNFSLLMSIERMERIQVAFSRLSLESLRGNLRGGSKIVRSQSKMDFVDFELNDIND